MEKLKIEELRKKLYLGDYGEYITDYNDGYISDIINEMADNNVDIYNYDLLQWCANNLYNIDYCDRAKDELGASDLVSMLQGGQYLQITDDLYENLENILINYMYYYIENYLELEEITEEQNDELLDFDFEACDKLEEIAEHATEILKENEYTEDGEVY